MEVKVFGMIDRRMRVYKRRSDFATEFDVILLVKGDPADVDENGVFDREEILLLDSEVDTIHGGDERGEDEVAVLAVSFSADEEALILEVASQGDGLELPFADVVVAHPRVETSIESVQFHGSIVRNTVAHRFPTCRHSLVLRIMVEGTVSRSGTQRGECNTASQRNSSKNAAHCISENLISKMSKLNLSGREGESERRKVSL